MMPISLITLSVKHCKHHQVVLHAWANTTQNLFLKTLFLYKNSNLSFSFHM